jgi:hypothetical protein
LKDGIGMRLEVLSENESGWRIARRVGKPGILKQESKFRMYSSALIAFLGLSLISAPYRASYNLLLPLHYLYLSYLSELLSLPPYQADLATQHVNAIASSSTVPALPSSKLANGLSCELISARVAKSDLTGAILRGKSKFGIALKGSIELILGPRD